MACIVCPYDEAFEKIEMLDIGKCIKCEMDCENKGYRLDNNGKKEKAH